jgi:hypothetical protein
MAQISIQWPIWDECVGWRAESSDGATAPGN